MYSVRFVVTKLHFLLFYSLNYGRRRQVGVRIGKAQTKPSSQTTFIYIYLSVYSQ